MELKLYEINEELTKIEYLLMENGGELSEDLELHLETLSKALVGKTDSCVEFAYKLEDQIKIAKQRVRILLDKADAVFNTNKSLANRYVTLARKIAMKFKTRIPSALKRRFCPHCYKFLRPGVNARVRLTKSKVVYYCGECKHFWRMPYLKEQRAKQRKPRSKAL